MSSEADYESDQSDTDESSPKFSSGANATLRVRILNEVEVLEKRSKHVDYTIELEYEIGKLLNGLNSDHFCRYCGLVKEHDPRSGKLTPKLLMEKIEGESLYAASVAYPSRLPVLEKRSFIARALAIAAVLNEEFNISHNDLHMNNVMLKKCDVDVQAYVFPDGEEMAALTYGKSPVLVDFGMAFPGEASDKMLMPVTMTDMGFFPHEMDELADARRLVYAATFFDTECVPVDIKQRLYLWRVDYFGTFDEGTFPNFLTALETLMEKEAGRSSASRLSLLAAHVRLPLERRESTGENPNHAFRAFKRGNILDQKEVTPIDIKNLLDDNVGDLKKKFPAKRIKDMQRALKAVLPAVNNEICLRAELASKYRREMYDSSSIEKTREVAGLLMSDVTYTPDMRVSVYDVASRNTVECSFDKKECSNLNSKRETLADIILDKLKGRSR